MKELNQLSHPSNRDNATKRHKRPLRLGWLLLGVLWSSGLCLPGCHSHSFPTKKESPQKSKLPKFKFHRPKSVEQACQRMREIHQALVSNSEPPAPKEYSVVEIIHGEGAGAHSHFYLEAEWDPDEEDHHEGEMKSAKRTHQVKLDVFTELLDIVNWTPKIAAAEEFSEKEWTSIKSVCDDFRKVLGDKFGPEQSDAAKRDAYQQIATGANDFIGQLEALTKNSTSQK